MDAPGKPPDVDGSTPVLGKLMNAVKEAQDPAVQEARKERQKDAFARDLMMGGGDQAPATPSMQPLQYQRPQAPQMGGGGPMMMQGGPQMMAQQGGQPPVAAPPMAMPQAGGMAPTRMVADRLNASPMGLQAPWAGLLAPGQMMRRR
jgi:hypothetical protein